MRIAAETGYEPVVSDLSLIVITPKVVGSDGQGRVNLEILRRLARRGARITIVAMEITQELRELGNIRAIRVPLARVPIQIVRSSLFSLVASAWLALNKDIMAIVQVDGGTVLGKSDINVSHFVHAAWGDSPFHVSRHDRGARGLYHKILNVVHRWEERRAYAATKQIIAVSSLVQRGLVAIGADSAKITVVPLGVDAEFYRPGPSDRRALGLPERVFLAAFAGDMTTPRKNLDTVLRALQSSPAVHLAVIGSLNKNPYPSLAKKLGVAGQVTFLGFRKDVAAVFRSCDAFVFPSRYEPFGLVVLEALASGLPVVTAQSTGASDLVTPKCGFVLRDAEDANGVAESLMQMQRDSAMLARMRAAARARAETYSWDAVAERFIAIYLQAAASLGNRRERLVRFEDVRHSSEVR